jgi:GDP-4-dehydro-6-deoxy-D-mannose reductase
MPTALITGIGGFVGAHLARAAADAGFTVIGLDLSGVPNPTDLLDPEAMRAAVSQARPDVVFHLAGALRAKDFRTLYDANVVGTANLLEALVEAALTPRVVVASSSAVYGNPTADGLIGEESELRPITHYAASKVAQEVVARRYFTALKLPVIIARSFNIIGPGQPSTLAAGAFAEQVARAERSAERTMRVGDLSGSRDFVDVRDVAAAYVSLARAGTAGATYNVSTGQATPLKRCVDQLLKLATVPIELSYDASRAQAHDVRAQVGNASRIAQDTGWVSKIPFEKSIEDLLITWRDKVARVGGAT